MSIAELRGKLYENISLYSEDFLTSEVFQALRYLDPSLMLIPVIGTSSPPIDPDCSVTEGVGPARYCSGRLGGNWAVNLMFCSGSVTQHLMLQKSILRSKQKYFNGPSNRETWIDGVAYGNQYRGVHLELRYRNGIGNPGTYTLAELAGFRSQAQSDRVGPRVPLPPDRPRPRGTA